MVRYVFILLNSMIVGCPSQPEASTDPGGGTQHPAPLVKFENAPSGSSTATSLSIKVKGANTATKEYAYAFVARGGVNCKAQSYSSWREFSTAITISSGVMGTLGPKTLCAKGRRADKTEQQEPIRRVWTLVSDAGGLIGDDEPLLEIALDTDVAKGPGSKDVEVTVTFKDITDADKSAEVTLTVTCDMGITAPKVDAKDAAEGTAIWGDEDAGGDDDAVTIPLDKAGKCEFKAEANLGAKDKSATATFTINAPDPAEEPEEEHTLELTDKEKEADKTDDGLQLSQKTLKFASTNQAEQTVTLENMGTGDIDWTVTTEQEELLFKVRKRDDSDWIDLQKDNLSELKGNLNTSGDEKTQELEFKLAHPYKTDYDGDKNVTVKINDGTNDVTLTLHILAPKLKISADETDEDITKKTDAPIWHVVLTGSTNSAKEKTLTLANTKNDLKVLDWDVFPYMWKPDWFNFEIDIDAGTLKLKKLADKAPEADESKKITLIIGSNSDSHGLSARSFAMSANQEITWKDEKETETQKSNAAWRTNDIRYVVVEFKEEE